MDERTKVYGEIAKDSFGDAIQAKEGIQYATTKDLLKVQGWLLGKPCMSEGETSQAKRVGRLFLNKRRRCILEELKLLNHVLCIEETRQEQEAQQHQPEQVSGDGKTLEEKVVSGEGNKVVTPASNQGQIYLDPKEARNTLFHFFQEPLITNIMFHLLMRDCIPLTLIERFNRLTEGYAFINLTQLGRELRTYDPKELFRTISSFPRDEIRELVEELTPAERYNKQIYVIRKDASIQEVCRGLEATKDSLRQGNFAYFDILEILKSKNLHPGSSYFNIVVQTIFKRLPEGTFERSSVEDFRRKSEGYHFVQLRTLVSKDYSKIPALIESLKVYGGPLIIRYPVNQDLIQGPDDPENIYLFKEPVDIEVLGQEIGLELTKPEPWIIRVKRRQPAA